MPNACVDLSKTPRYTFFFFTGAHPKFVFYVCIKSLKQLFRSSALFSCLLSGNKKKYKNVKLSTSPWCFVKIVLYLLYCTAFHSLFQFCIIFWTYDGFSLINLYIYLTAVFVFFVRYPGLLNVAWTKTSEVLNKLRHCCLTCY